MPSSAAITVAILALPTRGQGMEKAGFRFLATIIGVAASIAIAGFFSQTDGLLLAAFGIWVGLCVYAAAMLDGNRAYAAALCCITVALIAIQQIDSPQLVFPTGLARGAALTVGILAVALVNDVLAAPDYHPVLTDPPRSIASPGNRVMSRVSFAAKQRPPAWPPSVARYRGAASGDRKPHHGIQQWRAQEAQPRARRWWASSANCSWPARWRRCPSLRRPYDRAVGMMVHLA